MRWSIAWALFAMLGCGHLLMAGDAAPVGGGATTQPAIADRDASAPADDAQHSTSAPASNLPVRPDGWSMTIDAFAKSLIVGNSEATKSVLGDHYTIRTFQGETEADLAKLQAGAATAQLIGSHAYFFPPVAMAADVAADFKNAPEVPDDQKQIMIPADDAEIRRANATAIQWLASVLGVKDGEPIGVLIVWAKPVNNELGGDAKSPGSLLFVLVRGQEVTANRFVIKHVTWGNPLAGVAAAQ